MLFLIIVLEKPCNTDKTEAKISNLDVAYHPDHEVGKDCNPYSGQKERQHKVFLPAGLRTVWDGKVEKQQ